MMQEILHIANIFSNIALCADKYNCSIKSHKIKHLSSLGIELGHAVCRFEFDRHFIKV